MGGLIKRGSIYYALYYVEKKQKRISLETDCLQVAKKKLRQLESALYHGNDNPLPTKTPIANMITAYIEHMHSRCRLIRCVTVVLNILFSKKTNDFSVNSFIVIAVVQSIDGRLAVA